MTAPSPSTPQAPLSPLSHQAPPANQRPASRYALGSYGNMVRSLLVILAGVGVLLAIVPRSDKIDQPALDARSVAAQAGQQTGLPFLVPAGLPEGWKATSARYGPSTDQLMTWMGGWQTPSGGYVAIRQTKAASPAWVQQATADGTDQGTVQAGGTTWRKLYSTEHRQTSLVDVPTADGAGSVATVVTATAGMDEIEQFVAALQPAKAAA